MTERISGPAQVYKIKMDGIGNAPDVVWQIEVVRSTGDIESILTRCYMRNTDISPDVLPGLDIIFVGKGQELYVRGKPYGDVERPSLEDNFKIFIDHEPCGT